MVGEQTRKYIILPEYGYTSDILAQTAKLSTAGSVAVAARPMRVGAGQDEITVLDSLHDDGPKLVEMSPQAELDLRAEVPGLKIVPLVRFERMRVEPAVEKFAVQPTTVDVSIRSFGTNQPVAGAKVVAFTNFRHRTGAEAISGANGIAQLALAADTKLERLYVFGPPLFWSRLESPSVLASGKAILLSPIDLSRNDGVLASYYGGLPATAGSGVCVGVMNSGVQKDHPALPNVGGGRNMVFDETNGTPGAEADWGPAKIHGDHGTHVAGIIGMNQTQPSVLRGVSTRRGDPVLPSVPGYR